MKGLATAVMLVMLLGVLMPELVDAEEGKPPTYMDRAHLFRNPSCYTLHFN